MPKSILCVYIAILGLLSSALVSAQDGKLKKDHHGYVTRLLQSNAAEGRPYWATDLLDEIKAYAPPPPKANPGNDGTFWAANSLDDKVSKYGPPPPPRADIHAPPPPRADIHANNDGPFWAIDSLNDKIKTDHRGYASPHKTNAREGTPFWAMNSLNDKIKTDHHGYASPPKTNAHDGSPFWATNSARKLKPPHRITKTETFHIDTNSPTLRVNAPTADESQTLQTRRTIEHKTDPFQASGLASGGFGRGQAQVSGPGYAFGKGSGGGWGTNGGGHGSGSAFAGMGGFPGVGGSFPRPGASAWGEGDGYGGSNANAGLPGISECPCAQGVPMHNVIGNSLFQPSGAPSGAHIGASSISGALPTKDDVIAPSSLPN